MNPEEINKYENHFKSLHKEGVKGLWSIYGEKNFLIKPPIIVSFLLTTIICVLIGSIMDNQGMLTLLKGSINIGLALEGGLIGLTLAGLTLIVTFGSDKLMNHLIRDNLINAVAENKLPEHSIYQRTVAKFTFAVVVQIVSLLVLFIVNIFDNFEFSFQSEKGNMVVNTLTLFGCLFLMFYSLILVLQMTFNIFTLSQINHAVLSKEEQRRILNELKSKEGGS